MMTFKKGFSFIELSIVIAIIASATIYSIGNINMAKVDSSSINLLQDFIIVEKYTNSLYEINVNNPITIVSNVIKYSGLPRRFVSGTSIIGQSGENITLSMTAKKLNISSTFYGDDLCQGVLSNLKIINDNALTVHMFNSSNGASTKLYDAAIPVFLPNVISAGMACSNTGNQNTRYILTSARRGHGF